VRFVVRAHEVLLAESGRPITGRIRSVVGQGVRAVYRACRRGETPTERYLVDWLEEQATHQEDHEDKRLFKDVAADLYPYVRDGEHAALVDRPTSFGFDTRLLAFHIDPKELRPDTPIYAFVMFAMTDIADRRDVLAQEWGRRSGRGTVQHLLAIDEGWNIFLFNIHDTNDESGVDPRQWVARKLGLTEGEAAQVGDLAGKVAPDKKTLEYAQMFMIRTTKTANRAARGVVNVPSAAEEAWLFASDPDDKEYRARMVRAVARDPERPIGDEVYQAVCLLAEGATPAEVYAARVVPAPAHAGDHDDREAATAGAGGAAWTAAR